MKSRRGLVVSVQECKSSGRGFETRRYSFLFPFSTESEIDFFKLLFNYQHCKEFFKNHFERWKGL